MDLDALSIVDLHAQHLAVPREILKAKASFITDVTAGALLTSKGILELIAARATTQAHKNQDVANRKREREE
jgi:hypothetical protein